MTVYENARIAPSRVAIGHLSGSDRAAYELHILPWKSEDCPGRARTARPLVLRTKLAICCCPTTRTGLAAVALALALAAATAAL